MTTEKESYVADEGENKPLFEMSKLFDQVILLLGQAMNSCSYIRHFNVLMSSVVYKKRVEFLLKDNATAFSEEKNMLFGPKYEQLVAKSLSSKNRSKELFGSIKNQGSSKEGNRRQLFRKGSLFRTRRNRGRGMFTAAGKPYNINTLQEDKEGVRMNILIAPSINSMDLLSPSEFFKIHPLVVNLFPVKIKQLRSAGRVKHFVKNWQKLTNDPLILDIVRGYKIPFVLPSRQSKLPNLCQLTKQVSDLVDQEVHDMLRKGTIVVSDPKEDQFLSSLFLVKNGGNHPVVNLKDLNNKILYQHLEMEGLFLLKEMFFPGDKMCKIDLKQPYFAIPMSVKSRKYVMFQRKGLLYDFCCLCFGLSPAALVLTKLLKVSIFLLRKLNVRIITYLDDLLLMASSLEDLLMAADTLIFILQHLGFLINITKSYLEPTSTLEFLGGIVDSGEIILSLPKEKILKVQYHCQEILEKGKVTDRELSKLIGRLSSTAVVVLAASLHYCPLQHKQIQKLICNNSFEEKVIISVEATKELLWWKENLILCNGRSLISRPLLK